MKLKFSVKLRKVYFWKKIRYFTKEWKIALDIEKFHYFWSLGNGGGSD
jgi:hypothetical protein